MKLTHRLAAIFGSMLVLTVCSMGLASQVSAVAILDTGSPQFLGTISPDGGSPTEEAYQINVLLGLISIQVGDTNIYTASGNDCGGSCPLADPADSFKIEVPSEGDNTGDFGDGFTYLKGKYDAAQAGAYVWYVAGLTGEFEIPASIGGCGANGCGLSHWVLFNPGDGGAAPTDIVPEPSTLLLLGAGLVAMTRFARKSK